MLGKGQNQIIQGFLQGLAQFGMQTLLGLNFSKDAQQFISADTEFGNGDRESGIFFFSSSKTVGMRILTDLVTYYEQLEIDGTLKDSQKYTLGFLRDSNALETHAAEIRQREADKAYFEVAHRDDVTPETEQSVSNMLASLGMCGKAN